MRYADLLGKSKRDAPSDISDQTLRLAFRAGLIRPVEGGNFIYLTLAANVIAQMFLMLRVELNHLGAQELRGMPHVQLETLAAEIQSYKHLPAFVYWRGGGVTRLNLAALVANADAAHEARGRFERIAADFFEYAGVAARSAQELAARVWYATAPALDLAVFQSTEGSYAATRAAATPFKAPALTESPLSLQEVETPHCDTIESLAQFLNVPTSGTAKALFYATGERVILAVIRGDLQLDEDKVKRAVGADALRWATDEEIARVGAAPGYASPIGVRGATIVVDDSVVNSPNLVAGANKPGYHLLNTNVPRDYKPDIVADIALARAGDRSPDGQGELELVRAVALGNLAAPRELEARFLDVNGKAQKPFAVGMDLDLGAVLLAHVGAHHDDKGIVWTRALAPFDVHVIALNADKPEVSAALERVGDALDLAGLDALVDDRSESAGVKFNDADLIGLPLRITVGPKTVAQNAVEFKARTEANARLVELGAVGDELNSWMDRL